MVLVDFSAFSVVLVVLVKSFYWVLLVDFPKDEETKTFKQKY